MHEWDKSGGQDRSRMAMDGFKDVVNNFALCEVNYIRPHFTWWNAGEGNAMMGSVDV